MNRLELNRAILNAVSLNGVGLRKKVRKTESEDIPPITWEDYIASGVDILEIKNAKADSIVSLIVDGGCQQNGTPTPAAPIAIKCNKGNIAYGVLGKNLLEVKDENIVVGKYINNAGVVTASLPNLYFQRFVAVKASTAYTLSTSETLNYANFMEYDASGAFIKRTLYGSSGTPAGKAVTHTMGDTTAFVIVGSNVNSVKYPEITKEDVKAIEWMFCEGSAAKAYEAYRAGYSYDGDDVISIEGGASASADVLLGVTEYADRQDVVKGEITRKVGIKVFDGSESSWYLSMSGDIYRYRYRFDDDDNAHYKNGRGTDMFSTHFQVLEKGSSENCAFLNGSNNVEYLFLIPDQSITTLEDFRQWLHLQYAKGTPVMVTYPLAEDKVENVAPQPMSNPSGEVIIIRDAEVKGLAMEATIKVKSEGGGEIEFTIRDYNGEDRTFKAREGMTWREFCDSEYNTEGWYIDPAADNHVLLYTEGTGPWVTHYYYASETGVGMVTADQTINPSASYTTFTDGIGGV